MKTRLIDFEPVGRVFAATLALRELVFPEKGLFEVSLGNSSCPSRSSWLISPAFMQEERKTLEQRAQMTDIERQRDVASSYRYV
jgi:hypothetical protein